MYGPGPNEDHTRVTFEFLNQQTPGYDRPWRGDLDGANDLEKAGGFLQSRKQRRTFFQRWQVCYQNNHVPLTANLFSIYFLCTL